MKFRTELKVKLERMFPDCIIKEKKYFSGKNPDLFVENKNQRLIGAFKCLPVNRNRPNSWVYALSDYRHPYCYTAFISPETEKTITEAFKYWRMNRKV